ncbi:YopX family protein [Bacillus sp. C28GYM-DRY-1]|uniref:YopX family protein n=1 Tax=Bacillus sp. C28GYM-DRY-1 TaxID=3062686 RepID=UPI0026775286|nr:YopX family protein [Bacillus sp. C28GYM-DRY-1]MDO3660128.1 YopX family protein [Bacillus sp. C28GYM-DRY-1]
MDIIKIRYTFRHKGSGNLEMKWYSIGQLEERAAAKLSPVFSDEYELISRDLYTGLKDKNGQEIYEGDIVQGSHHYQRDDEIILIEQQVNYLNGCYMFGNWNAHEYFNKHRNIEVIGDVSQNPELLEASHASK